MWLILAPDRAPRNIQWTMIGSTLSLHWDPVVAMETESKVTGYLVRANINQKCALCLRLVILNKNIYIFLLSQVLLKKNHYNDISTIFTNKTAVELTLSTNGNYLIQVKTMSEGGEGVGSEPIHIHKLSEFTLVLSLLISFRPLIKYAKKK